MELLLIYMMYKLWELLVSISNFNLILSNVFVSIVFIGPQLDGDCC